MLGISWRSLVACILEMDSKDYKPPVGAEQTEAGMEVCPIPPRHLCDKVFTHGSRPLATVSPLALGRELQFTQPSHVCCSRGNMLVRLFLSSERCRFLRIVVLEVTVWRKSPHRTVKVGSCPPGDSAMLCRPVWASGFYISSRHPCCLISGLSSALWVMSDCSFWSCLMVAMMHV